MIDKECQIVALNVEQFGPGYPGQYCFQEITISYNGKTIQATITDKVRSTLMSHAVPSMSLEHSAWDVLGVVSISLVVYSTSLRKKPLVYSMANGG